MNPALLSYLGQVNAAMAPPDGGLTAAPVGPLVDGGDPFGIKAMASNGPPPAPPPAAGPPPIAAAAPPAPGVDYPPAITGDLGISPGVGAAPTNDPLAAKRGVQTTDAIPTPAPPPDVNGPGGGIPDRPFPLQAVGGSGVVPAHEVDLRGPSLTAAQHGANATTEAAIGANTANTQAVARDEYAMFLDQARQAQVRQAAAEQAQAERDEELQQRAQDFDSSVKALGKMAFQPDGGWWASRSSPQKISAIVSLGLGGFLQGARGGTNPGLDIINQHIEREVRAQEFAFQAGMQQANAKQTAFGMAMQKYGDANAARAMVRAAAIDGVQSQIAAQSALWKDADAANRANAAMAELENQKMAQIAQGVRFILPQAVGRRWVDPRTGLVYSEQEAKAMATEMRGQEFKREEIGLNTAGDVLKEGVKAGLQGQKQLREQQVQLPNGDVIDAPSAPEAAKLRDLSTAVLNAQQLVAEAKKIRQGTAWRVPGTAERQRLESIQSELTLAFKDRGGLGALSGPDMDLALGSTGTITSQMPNAEAKLDQFKKATDNALRNRVRTIPGSPGTARGDMPASFTAHGKK